MENGPEYNATEYSIDRDDSHYLSSNEWVLYKSERGLYRPRCSGYTESLYFAGKYSGKFVWNYVQAHPNIVFYHVDVLKQYMHFYDKELFHLVNIIEDLQKENTRLHVSDSMRRFHSLNSDCILSLKRNV